MEPTLDDLKTPSVTEKEPLFSFQNFFRPTSKNVTIWATTIKGICVAIGISAFATESKWIFLGATIVGGLAEAFIYFTKEEPVSTITRAVEDIHNEQLNEHVSN